MAEVWTSTCSYSSLVGRKIRPHSIDVVVRAELPDPDQDPNLHEIIKSTPIHGPCEVFNFNSSYMLAVIYDCIVCILFQKIDTLDIFVQRFVIFLRI
ncbi:hypothetical protein NPIL_44611 [Nephila pilipes]|uniref:Uncharacterized protein n=1 Tax=Nephila pilipes TaxID=299642 RepID=A0A8X6INR5_NEPPI|nr:hypothetical protein NPIL_44611 [Nephila pilipes]